MLTNRREFLWRMTALGGCAALPGCRMFGGGGVAPTAASVPSYWCTWCREVALAADKGRRTKLLFPGDQGTIGARDTIDERSLFGADGWARYFPNERGDLLLVIDDGWDVPYGLDPWSRGDMSAFGSLEPHPSRFPSFGKTPVERLSGIVSRAKDFGWKGLGIWVACQCPGETRTSKFSPDKVDEWLKRKLDESARAGVAYWKVDWGVRDHNAAYRARMTELKSRYYPELIVEHMPFHCEPVLSADFAKAADCPYNRAMVESSDVIRTYDVLPPIDLSATLSRVAAYSRLIDAAGSRTALNVEDRVIVGAVLGHAIGIMRAPDERSEETAAAVRWLRLAPSFGGHADFPTRCSEKRLTEDKTFGPGEGWYAPTQGKTWRQDAPAVMARGMNLPQVTALSGERPFVIAGRNPNGSLAVAALPRCVNGKFAAGEVDIEIGEVLRRGQQLAVFGAPRQLRIRVGSDTADFRVADLATGGSLRRPSVVVRDGWLTLMANGECKGIVVSVR